MHANGNAPRAPRRVNRRRRGGQILVYMAIGIIAILMTAAITIDLGYLYNKHAQIQAAADSAALGGAWQLANFKTTTQAFDWARYYAALPENGAYVANTLVTSSSTMVKYTDPTDGTIVTVTYPAKDEQGVTQSNWIRTDVSRPYDTFFGGMAGKKSVMVGAYAVAIYETLAPLDISGTGSYGATPGVVNLTVFGPDGLYSNGDCYSAKYLDDKTTPNPLYDGKGYDFQVTVPTTLTNTTLELFDPDCYNSGGQTAVSTTAIDEIRLPSGNVTSNTSNAATTRYNLYDDNGTPNNPNDDILIKSQSYGYTSATDMKWNDFLTFDRSAYGTHNFRVNVTSTSGSSENGYSMRIGPKRTGSQAFSENNGTKISAVGHLPLNFNQDGAAKIALGTVPVEAAGGQLTIRKFDTDVGSQSVVYTCSTLPGMSWAGKLSANGAFATDSIQVPAGYNTAGTWYAVYTAGANDTSVWNMSYSNSGPGRPGYIKLIR